MDFILCLGLDIWVTKVMKPCVRKANRGGNPLEIMIDRIRGQVFPDFVAENEAAILPKGSRLQPRLRLLDLVPPQDFHHEGSNCNYPAFTIFG